MGRLADSARRPLIVAYAGQMLVVFSLLAAFAHQAPRKLPSYLCGRKYLFSPSQPKIFSV
jgi:hypothetical protein